MNEIKKITFFLLFILCFLQTVKAQVTPDSLDHWYILLKSKNEYTGQIIEKEGRIITFLSESSDTMIFNKKRVKYLEPFDPKLVIDSSYWPRYRITHHNLFTPSGHVGEYYFKNTLVYMNTFNIPFSERSSMGFGFFPLIAEDDGFFYFWVSPKFAIPTKKENFKLSVGYYAALTPNPEYDNESTLRDQYVGFVYSVGTYTFEKTNFSFGTGYGRGYGEFFKWPFYTININFQYKPRFSLHCEVFGGGSFPSTSLIAVRKHTKKCVLDLGWAFFSNRERFSQQSFNGPLFPYGGPFVSLIFTSKRSRKYGIL